MFSVKFSAVIDLPDDYEVYDFTEGYDPDRIRASEYGVGRYNEKRPSMYSHEMYKEDLRDIHMGIDIAAPVGTPIKSFYDGEIFLFGNNNQPGDYGFTIVTKHSIEDKTIYALFGHLSASSIQNISIGQKLSQGEVFCWVGDKKDNGGWNPHLHFQLCWERPKTADMPGVVSEKDLEDSLKVYPDPSLVLGKLY